MLFTTLPAPERLSAVGRVGGASATRRERCWWWRCCDGTQREMNANDSDAQMGQVCPS